MEPDQLKLAWNTIQTPVKTNKELSSMLIESKHPVLKDIRKQFTIEIIGWSVFLLCYYTMFDGDQKPVAINVLLVVSMLFALIHNILGYNFSKYLINGDTIKLSLERYLSKIKVYAAISISSRVVLITGFLVFFTYNINFTTSKYVLLAGVIAVSLVQLRWLFVLWSKRLKVLGKTIKEFSLENENQ
ncbi:hypothetical protein [Pedobacter sp. B4-66]|uniref:hypothetical protein n=1 Tax=Pedobacter sp. B4-66 TaxID=2817280 RepID=UPI001BD95B97|nr:hypothetical protein [Pedobacter sp. B4-66]